MSVQMHSSQSLMGMLRFAVDGPPEIKKLTPTHNFLFLQGVLYFFLGMQKSTSALEGVLYFVLGMQTWLVPETAHYTFLMPPLEPAEAQIARLGGMGMMVVGYFYMQMARTNSPFVVAASIFNRLLLVPPMFAVAGMLGARWQVCLAIALLDTALALLTFHRWQADPANGSGTHQGYEADVPKREN
mmetsp:Transcript_2025/g.4682  ORF Transcript_2025/g.4682 Transcript_2025/m.4682 type:complete len:186 (-) Transcript_2025:25-582(-)